MLFLNASSMEIKLVQYLKGELANLSNHFKVDCKT